MTMPEIFRVDRRTEEYPGTFTLNISPRKAGNPPTFAPGQFNMLYVFGAGEVPISMSGPAANHTTYVHTIRSLGLATQALERLREGDEIGVRGPFGGGWPLEQAAGKHVLFIAGGLGLAPLRPAIYALISEQHRTRGLSLFYGARNPGEMLYRAELQEWARQMDVHTTVDQASPDWQGHVGVVTSLLTGFTPESASMDSSQTVRSQSGMQNTLAFICGPEIMMRFSLQELLRQGMPPSSIYLSMERNMKCATGHCGHCQWGPNFICKDGPVFCYEDIQQWFYVREL